VVWVVDGDMIHVRVERRVRAMTISPHARHQALFVTLDRETREAGRGLRGAT
jgi:hypothetical protein